MDFGDENVGRVDAKTFRATIYPTPTAHSRPRRTMLDDKGHLWFAEFAANKLGMFDLDRESIKEWDVPTPFTFPYDVYRDRTGDRLERLDVERSGAAVRSRQPANRSSICLPRQTNIRRIFIDDTHEPGDILGREQSPCGDFEGGVAGAVG